MATIKVENLYKVFGHRPKRAFPRLEKGQSKDEILEDIGCTVGINDASFSVNKRETFVIMGLSGSGKSTVIRCLNRLIRPTCGKVLIDDENIMEMDKERMIEVRRQKLSMVFQNFGLLPHRTVVGNVEFGLEVAGENSQSRRKKAMDALELVGLKGYENSMTKELSGGMQQRVGLARALANDPEVLLMDEAFSALDPLIRAQMQDELLELQAKMHKTIVFITHDLDEALKLGDRIAIMKDGAVVQIGTPEEILTEPADDYVRTFVQKVDRAQVITASAIVHHVPTIAIPKDGPQMAIREMEKLGSSSIFVLNHDRILQGLLTIDDAVALEESGTKSKDLKSKLKYKDIYFATPDTVLSSLSEVALTTKYPVAICDDQNKFIGIVDRASVIAEMFKGQKKDADLKSLENATETPSTGEEK